MNDFFSPSAQQLSPRSAKSRRSIFKMLSETLRPHPSITSQQQPWSMKSRNEFPKINKQSLRLGKEPQSARPSFPPFYSSVNDPSSRFSFLKDMSMPKSANRAMPKLKIEGNVNQSQSTSSLINPKNCHLTNVLRSAKRCLQELRQAKENLSYIVAEDEQLARGIKKANPNEQNLVLSQVALSITSLCREAFVPAHRLNQTGIALYSAEDFLRYPSDIRTFNLLANSAGRIKLPDMSFNSATVMKLRQVVDLAAETYNKFSAKGRIAEDLQEILFSILRGYQDFYAAALGCQEIFKVLLYTGPKDKAHLQQFLLALSSVDRSDLLVEVQDLRRILDEIVIFLEKFSWGSFLIFRLAGGETAGAVTSSGGEAAKSSGGMPTYPAYPLLRAKGPRKKKVITENDIESINKLTMSPTTIEQDFKDNSSFVELESGRGEKARSKSKFSRRSRVDAIHGAGASMEEKMLGDSQPHHFSKKSELSVLSSNL